MLHAVVWALGDRRNETDDALHIAYQNPARTLRRIAALRRIVERHKVERWRFSTHDVETCQCSDELYPYPCPDLLDIADALGVEPPLAWTPPADAPEPKVSGGLVQPWHEDRR